MELNGMDPSEFSVVKSFFFSILSCVAGMFDRRTAGWIAVVVVRFLCCCCQSCCSHWITHAPNTHNIHATNTTIAIVELIRRCTSSKPQRSESNPHNKVCFPCYVLWTSSALAEWFLKRGKARAACVYPIVGWSTHHTPHLPFHIYYVGLFTIFNRPASIRVWVFCLLDFFFVAFGRTYSESDYQPPQPHQLLTNNSTHRHDV